MDIRYKLYPYPVLSNYSDDYINSSFDSAKAKLHLYIIWNAHKPDIER